MPATSVSVNTHETSLASQGQRLKFKRYNGEGDPIIWVAHCEQYFEIYGILDKNKVSLASYHLEDEALLWFQLHKKENMLITWEDFKQEIFLDMEIQNLRIILRSCPNFGNLQQFRNTTRSLPDLLLKQWMSQFLNRLASLWEDWEIHFTSMWRVRGHEPYKKLWVMPSCMSREG